MNKPFDDLINFDDVLKQDQREKQALGILLDKQRERKEHLLAVRISMGSTKRSYITSATLDWVAAKVRFATELPLFKDHRDQHGNVKMDDRLTVDIIQQRRPDWRRQFPMTLYLARRANHKFPPILLAISQEWVDNDRADEWDKEGRALRDSISAQFLDTSGLYCDIHITPSDWIYALDGQHRLMAIKGLNDLINQGKLFPKNEDSSQGRKPPITLEEIADTSRGQVTEASLQGLLAESIGMELVPAVLKGETRKEALRRLRSMFVHVNRMAKPLSTGELALLDEDNGFSVIARLAMVEHPLLKGRVRVKKGNLSEKAREFTTLETLETIAEEYLGQMPKYQDWKKESHSEMAIRPDEVSLDNGAKALLDYFTKLSEIRSHKEMMNAGVDEEYVASQRSNAGEANLLFRPLGQSALASAVGTLVNRPVNPVKLADIVDTLKKKEGVGLLRCDTDSSPWLGPAANLVTGKINRAGPALIARLFVHLLGGGTPDRDERDKLREDFAESRRVGSQEENKARNLSGRDVKLEDVELPTPWL